MYLPKSIISLCVLLRVLFLRFVYAPTMSLLSLFVSVAVFFCSSVLSFFPIPVSIYSTRFTLPLPTQWRASRRTCVRVSTFLPSRARHWVGILTLQIKLLLLLYGKCAGFHLSVTQHLGFVPSSQQFHTPYALNEQRSGGT